MPSINQILSRAILPRPLSPQDSAAAIMKVIDSKQPAMIARFGAVEIKAVLYSKVPSFLRPFIRKNIFSSMRINAGFFPISETSINSFSSLMFNDMKELDILGSWRFEERFLRRNFPNASLVDLISLEPYYSNHPWTKSLAGRKVLVVHPFSATIQSQYENRRASIYKHPDILPEFKSLSTIKAVQTIAGNDTEFPNWFSALEHMKSQISQCDFDVAILGCGAYGFPLAAHIKRIGKQAIHLGGATQILFGIKGKRWDDHPLISSFYNDFWVRPSVDEIPAGNQKVENGCYW